MSEMLEKLQDYFDMGVQAVWIIDLCNRRAFAGRPDGSLETVTDELTVVDTDICVAVSSVFAELDEMENLG